MDQETDGGTGEGGYGKETKSEGTTDVKIHYSGEF